MDLNTFGNPPLSPSPLQQDPNLMLSSQPAYPVSNQSQQLPFYPNATPQYPPGKIPHDQQQHLAQQQQHQRFSFGATPITQPVGSGGAMMPSGLPQSSANTNVNFSAPFAQPSIPTTMNQFSQPQSATPLNVPATGTPSFPSNMTSVSANNVLPTQQRPNQQLNGAQLAAQAAVQAQVAAREKSRVSTLLDINSMLLQEVINLQAAGKAGAPPSQPGQETNPSPTTEQTTEAPKGSGQKPSQEYIECMRRLQANLAYLASIADRAKKSGGVPPTAPAIMTPPPNAPHLNEIYGKLVELFPRANRAAVGTPQSKPGLQVAQGNGRPSPSSALGSAT